MPVVTRKKRKKGGWGSDSWAWWCLTFCCYEKWTILTTLRWESKTSHMRRHFFSSSSTVFQWFRDQKGVIKFCNHYWSQSKNVSFHPSSASSSSSQLPFSGWLCPFLFSSFLLWCPLELHSSNTHKAEPEATTVGSNQDGFILIMDGAEGPLLDKDILMWGKWGRTW